MTTQTIEPGACRHFIAAVMRGLGATQPIAARWAELLVETSLLGFDSHGIRMLERYVKHVEGGGIHINAEPEIVSQTGSCILMDAGGGLGHISADRAMNRALEKAGESGLSCVTVRNSNHIGSCGIYTRQAALRDRLGMCTTLSKAVMAPWGSKTPLMGSNPISFAAPIEGRPPFLFDAATSTVAMGHITKARDLGQSIPDTWALDRDGHPTSDPKAAKGGSLLPMGGHKGYGLALAMEILCALLSGGPFSSQVESWIRQTQKPIEASFTMIVIQIEAFQEVSGFKRRLREMVDLMTSAKRRPGVDRIYYPGEREGELYEQRSVEGIPVDENDTKMLGRVAGKTNVPLRVDSLLSENGGPNVNQRLDEDFRY